MTKFSNLMWPLAFNQSAIPAIFFTLRLAGISEMVFSQTVERQGCLSPSAWMESLSLRKDFAANTLPNKENRPVVPEPVTN